MNIHNESLLPKTRSSALCWILASVAIGIVCFYFVWAQSERERIAPWKEGWNYAGASEALKMGPNQPSAHVAMASVWMKQKQYDNAIQEYQKAIKLEPGNAYNYLDLGNAYASSGQLSKAKPQWQQAINLDVSGGEASNQASSNLARSIASSN